MTAGRTVGAYRRSDRQAGAATGGLTMLERTPGRRYYDRAPVIDPALIARTAAGMTAREKILRVLACMTWLVYGLGFTVGPERWRSSTSYYVLQRAMPMRAWGLVFLAIAVIQGIFLARRRLCPGMLLGAMVASGWAFALVFAWSAGQLAGPGAVPLWTFFAVTQIILNRWLPGWARHPDG